MKKMLTIVKSIVLGALCGAFVFAASANGFVDSPSINNTPPAINDFENENEDCDCLVGTTVFGEKDKLSEDAQEKMEAAYEIIAKNADITKVVTGLKDVLADKKIPAANVAVSELFDISSSNIDVCEHGKFTINIQLKNAEKFVAFLHYVNNAWEVVEDAEVDTAKQTLTFSTDNFSPFAIVVDTGDISIDTPAEKPAASMHPAVIVLIVAVALSAAAAAALFILDKKQAN